MKNISLKRTHSGTASKSLELKACFRVTQSNQYVLCLQRTIGDEVQLDSCPHPSLVVQAASCPHQGRPDENGVLCEIIKCLANKLRTLG
jgi:hypothetical protein